MYRVLLADTDQEAIQNFRRYMASSYPDFQVVKSISAAKGDVIADIIKADPQLIVTDIRFFGVNGPRAFAEISKKLPEVRFILYGGYNDLDYLERAIEDRKVEYIIKPVKPPDFGRALESAGSYFQLLEQRAKQLLELGETFRQKTDEFRSLFMQSLVSGVILDENEIRENFRHFNLNLNSDFTAVQIKIDHFKKVNLAMSIEEKHYLIYRIFNIVDLSLSGFKHFCFISGFNTVTAVISDTDDIYKILTLMENIKSEIGAKLKTAVTIGVGRTYKNCADISTSYNEAESATSQRFYIGYNTVIPIEFVDGDNFVTYRYPTDKERKLIFAAASGEFEYCKNLLNEIFSALRKSAPLPNKLMAQTVICILIAMERYLIEQNKYENVRVGSFFNASDVLNIKTVDDGYAYMFSNLQKFCTYVMEVRHEYDSSKLLLAKEYVNKKYYENISLQKAAMEVKTTPEYLNELFMSNERAGYFEYVTKVRMDIAKKFLSETEMDEKAIAVNIGYSDARYFKAVFRQYENMNPLEYRRMYRGSL